MGQNDSSSAWCPNSKVCQRPSSRAFVNGHWPFCLGRYRGGPRSRSSRNCTCARSHLAQWRSKSRRQPPPPSPEKSPDVARRLSLGRSEQTRPPGRLRRGSLDSGLRGRIGASEEGASLGPPSISQTLFPSRIAKPTHPGTRKLSNSIARSRPCVDIVDAQFPALSLQHLVTRAVNLRLSRGDEIPFLENRLRFFYALWKSSVRLIPWPAPRGDHVATNHGFEASFRHSPFFCDLHSTHRRFHAGSMETPGGPNLIAMQSCIVDNPRTSGSHGHDAAHPPS